MTHLTREFFISKLNCLKQTVVDKKVLEHYFTHTEVSVQDQNRSNSED